jgi:pyochelin synthetase
MSEKNIWNIKAGTHSLYKIESELLKAPGVKNCAVVQYNQNEKNKLLAFIVRNSSDNEQYKKNIDMIKFIHPASDEVDASLSETIVNHFNRILEETVVHSVFTNLKQNNVFGKQGEWISKKQMEENLLIKQDKELILTKWLKIFTDRGYLSKQGQLFLENSCRKKTNALWKELKREPLNHILPECVIDYIRIHTDHICDLFRDSCHPINFLFPNGTTTVAEKLYGETAISRYLNNVLADIVYIFSEGRKVKILEVGGGIGATTDKIVKRMGKRKYEYMFTDLSFFFLNNIKRKYPFIQTQLMNLDNTKINAVDNFYDIIVAAGVLNVTKDIPRSMNNLVSMLDDDGIILFIEPVDEHIEIDASQAFMMLKHEDIRKDTGKWYLSEAEWKGILYKHGLEVIRIFPPDGNFYRKFCQNLFIVCKNRNIRDNFLDFLRERLPAAMIPQEYYFVDNIPVTLDGEIDKSELCIKLLNGGNNL